LYGLGSKSIEIDELLGQYGDADFSQAENTNSQRQNRDTGLLAAVDQLAFSESEDEEDADSMAKDEFMAENDVVNITQFPSIAATIPVDITITTLNGYRRNGPFGKLYAIGVLFRKSSDLQYRFRTAQLAKNPSQKSLKWVHNVATRWFSDYAMAERAVLLRPALNRLFVCVEIGWFRRGSVAHKRPEILAYKLTDSEWQIVNILLLIL
jgi:hypothetical protein